MKFCGKCGSSVPDEANVCPVCGAGLNIDSSNGYPYPPEGNPTPIYPNNPAGGYPMRGGYGAPAPGPNGQVPGKGLAVASMVLGIVALVFLLFFPYLSPILGIVGIVLAVVAKNHGYVGGMQSAGFVMSIIATALSIITIIACVACLGSAGVLDALSDL